MPACVQDLHPRACALALENGCKNADAWRMLLEQLASKRVASLTHPSDCIRRALQQYVAFGMSSSGVEQAFSKASWFISSRRQHARPMTEEYLFKLACDLPLHKKAEVSLLARKVWADCFGEARTWTGRRIDKGLKRPRDASSKPGWTEADFIRKRRAASSDAAHAIDDAGDFADAFETPDETGWNQKLEAEMKHQQKKHHSRRIQALSEGALLPEEKSAALQSQANEVEARRCKDHFTRTRKAARHSMALEGASAAATKRAIRGLPAHIDESFRGERREGLLQDLREASLNPVDSRTSAKVFVLNKLSEASQRTRWAAAVCGGFLVHANFLTRGMGPVIKYKAAAVGMPRTIYVSEQWQAHRPNVWQTFCGALGGFGESTWTVERNLQSFLVFKRRWTQSGQPSRGLAIVREHEKTKPDPASERQTADND